MTAAKKGDFTRVQYVLENKRVDINYQELPVSICVPDTNKGQETLCVRWYVRKNVSVYNRPPSTKSMRCMCIVCSLVKIVISHTVIKGTYKPLWVGTCSMYTYTHTHWWCVTHVCVHTKVCLCSHHEVYMYMYIHDQLLNHYLYNNTMYMSLYFVICRSSGQPCTQQLPRDMWKSSSCY